MSGIPLEGWLIFGALAAVLLSLDLFLHRRSRETSTRAAVVWSGVWIGVGLAFVGVVYALRGGGAAVDYLATYLIEKSLSVDNLFVFLLIFQSLDIPSERQHTVLFWGILGALVLRGAFVFAGAAAIRDYEWVVYVFGAVLLWAAWRSAREDPAEAKESRIVGWLTRHLPVTREIHGDRFVTRAEGSMLATPLLVALLALETTDVVFAVDSVPAALSISQAEFVVYSSNVFAILGLRALYLALASALDDLRYLHYGVAFVLAFTGVKMLASPWIHIPAWLSILVVVMGIGAAVLLSLRSRRGARTPRAQCARRAEPG